MNNGTEIIVSAPGSLMLMGEHAVLHDRHALVMAIDQRLRVALKPNESKKINIFSEGYASHSISINTLIAKGPFDLIIQAINNYGTTITRGFDLNITSDFSDQLGFGSSAAVTVATLAALSQWLNGRIIKADVFTKALATIRHIQGLSSGADVAASVYGGILLYKMSEVINRFELLAKISAWYSGNKIKTYEVLAKLQPKIKNYPQLYNHIFDSIDECVMLSSSVLQQPSWEKFGELINIHQGLQDALGVNTPILQDLIEKLRQDSSILGAKISGAGMGDCVIGLGEMKKTNSKQFILSTDLEGVQCEAG